MHYRLLPALLLPILLLLATPAAAQNYPVSIGPGLSSCAQYQRLHQQDPSMRDAFYAWASGYLSGLNDRFIDTHDPTNLLPPNRSTDAQEKFLDDFCSAHPNAPYMQGVVALFAEMRREQRLGVEKKK
jgi:hypothetical protein